jgi:hypothetical protein
MRLAMSGDIGHMLALVHNIDRNLGVLVSLALDIRKVFGYVQFENAVVAGKQPEYLSVRDGAKVTDFLTR